MNKETWNTIKKLVDGFVEREELLKEILEDRESEIIRLQKELNYDGE